MITGKRYDTLKFLTMVVLPATGTLYFTLATIWGLPAAEQVVGTIAALTTFLGVTLQISSQQYKKDGPVAQAGALVVSETDEKVIYSLELDGDPEALKDKKEVMFKVRHD